MLIAPPTIFFFIFRIRLVFTTVSMYVLIYTIIPNHRRDFYKMIQTSPLGRVPNDWSLHVVYTIIDKTKCCGINENKIWILPRVYTLCF